jgi:hypothetical protein
MRTVHETEALRPSDPVPKSMQAGPQGKGGKIKIIMKTNQQSQGPHDDMDDTANGDESNAEYFTPLTPDLFTPDELELPVDKLYRKCHWESKWAEEIGESLTKECKEWEEIYYKEWLEKEVLLSQVIKSEVNWHERRQAILTGVVDVHVPGAVDSVEGEGRNGANVESEGVANGTKVAELTA